jgi:hypothetical protein
MSSHGGGPVELRRAISLGLAAQSGEEKRGRGEEVEATYRCGREEETGRH